MEADERAPLVLAEETDPEDEAKEPEKQALVSRTPQAAKLALLVALLVQNTLLNLAARRFRVQAEIDDRRTGCGCLSTLSVVTTEAMKLVMSFWLLWLLEASSMMEALAIFASQTRDHPRDAIKIVVPAVCYVLSNNMVLLACNYLEAPILVLFGGLRILAVGFYSVTLLRRELGLRRWLALVLLAASIVCVQTDKKRASPDHEGDEGSKNLLLGLFFAALACAITGFAGVYFELVLKNSTMSVWVRNVHLAAVSLPFAVTTFLTTDRLAVGYCGLFAGCGVAAWTYITVKAVGGLLIAAVIKYADNILKNFASAASIVTVAIISTSFYNFTLSPMFYLGASGLMYSILLYGDALRDLPGCNLLPPALGGKSHRPCCPSVVAPPNERRSSPVQFES